MTFEAVRRVSLDALHGLTSKGSDVPSTGNLSGLSGFSDSTGYTVYSGWKDGKLQYIGTTIQKPSDRFRWHKHNGKDLKFIIEKQFNNEDEMLDYEFELIKKHRPPMNNITHRKQNLNKRLTPDAVEARRGNAEWCQSCLKRRVNKGYSKCYRCSN